MRRGRFRDNRWEWPAPWTVEDGGQVGDTLGLQTAGATVRTVASLENGGQRHQLSCGVAPTAIVTPLVRQYWTMPSWIIMIPVYPYLHPSSWCCSRQHACHIAPIWIIFAQWNCRSWSQYLVIPSTFNVLWIPLTYALRNRSYLHWKFQVIASSCASINDVTLEMLVSLPVSLRGTTVYAINSYDLQPFMAYKLHVVSIESSLHYIVSLLH